MSGDAGDQRDAKIGFKHHGQERTLTRRGFRGDTTRNVPVTGTGVYLVSGELVDDIISESGRCSLQRFLGGSDNIPAAVHS